MTRIYKDVEIPAEPAKMVKRLDYVSCSFCGKRAAQPSLDVYDASNWERSCPAYEFETVVVKLSSGTRYPEGDHIETTQWDICPNCFNERIRPHLPNVFEQREVDF